MSTFTVKIDTDNAAFDDPSEIARILKSIAADCENGAPSNYTTIRDVNGNDVGRYAEKGRKNSLFA